MNNESKIMFSNRFSLPTYHQILLDVLEMPELAEARTKCEGGTIFEIIREAINAAKMENYTEHLVNELQTLCNGMGPSEKDCTDEEIKQLRFEEMERAFREDFDKRVGRKIELRGHDVYY